MTVVERIESYVRTLPPHVKARLTAQLLIDAITEIRSLTGRDNPKRCACCGEVREASEVPCGQCGCPLDGPCE